MQIDIFSATGSKVRSMDLPPSLFGSEVNWGLMHQAVVMQQSNARQSPAHVKTRGEVQGSTRKLISQKHTGSARRGSVRAPLLRGGGKIFGPRNIMNPIKDMPKKMRHAALRSALALQASKNAVAGIDAFPDTIKTKTVVDMLKKLPVQYGRKILVVLPAAHNHFYLSARNITGVHTVIASHLNIEEVLGARHLLFLGDAIEKADAIFGKNDKPAKTSKAAKGVIASDTKDTPKKAPRKMVKKPVSKKTLAKRAAAASSKSK